MTGSLVARTRVVDDGGDLIGRLGPDGFAWIRDGIGFVTGGVTARVDPDHIEDALAQITVRDEVSDRGTGAIAVGHLPFDAATPASMIIPAWVEGRRADGSAWRTEIGTDATTRATTPVAVGTSSLGTGALGHLVIRELMDRARWDQAVAAALAAIEDGTLVKVVLARAIRVEADQPIEPAWVLRRLATREPDRFLYAHDGFVGASPELLIRRTGNAVTARPLAGTEPVAPDRAPAERLTQSTKQQHEHRVVIAAITEVLGEHCQDVVAGNPEVTELPDVAHLVTNVSATAGPETPSALGLARALHPTPAVGGVPRGVALDLIRRFETVPRGKYAGPVGWVDQRGDGEFAVALRGAQLDGATAIVHAGAGIVAGSVVESEWAETTAKLEPILHALTTR
ncbi:MAG: isochorismate synthase [Acidimicrobiia bacterium]|nr:isochorismate synthase [Acidimicrobiia bacterium]